jgi:CubicO group peptidase (beta-lactamase class C family)
MDPLGTDTGMVDGGQLSSQADGGPDFSALQAFLDERLRARSFSGYAMLVRWPDGGVAFRSEGGICTDASCPGEPAYTADLVTGIASSSKWVTSTVTLAVLDELVTRGTFSSLEAALDTPVVDRLGCAGVTGPVMGITFRHLLSFTSGLVANHDCSRGVDLQSCACDVLQTATQRMAPSVTPMNARTAAHPPGTTYKYGDAHHVVAGAVVERLTDSTWEAVFQRLVATKLGLTTMRYRSKLNLAGSVASSVVDYSLFVQALRDDASAGSATPKLLSPAAVAAQRASQVPDTAVVVSSPREGLDYGLNVWRWCYRPFTVQEVLSPQVTELSDSSCGGVFQVGHGGKGGYQPFVDSQGRYSGVFAMREQLPSPGETYTPEEMGITLRVRLLAHLAMSGR